MNKIALTALTAAALLSTTLGAAHAQTLTADADDATVYFTADTGRAGAVDVVVDGQVTTANVLATDGALPLALTAGDHSIVVKNSYDNTVLASTTVTVAAGHTYAVVFQNDSNAMDYDLAFLSGSQAVHQFLNE